jgi:hypothetical protein
MINDVIDTESGSFTFTAGANGINNGSLDFLVDPVVIMLVTAVPSQDADTIAGFAELTVRGSSRKTLIGKSVTREGRRSVFRAANPTPWTLAPGGEVVGAVISSHGIPLFFLEMRTSDFPGGPLSGIPTNGSTFAVLFHDDGIGYSQQ